jgi:hypothetical protein
MVQVLIPVVFRWISPRLLTVNHSLLVHKIHQYGIRGKVNSWIKSWLSGRNQTVVVEGVNSSQVDVDSLQVIVLEWNTLPLWGSACW